MNFQKIKDETGNVTYKYVRVGSWETGQLSINESIIYWPSSGFGSEVESVCSDPCTKGSVKVRKLLAVWYMYSMYTHYKYTVE